MKRHIFLILLVLLGTLSANANEVDEFENLLAQTETAEVDDFESLLAQTETNEADNFESLLAQTEQIDDGHVQSSQKVLSSHHRLEQISKSVIERELSGNDFCAPTSYPSLKNTHQGTFSCSDKYRSYSDDFVTITVNYDLQIFWKLWPLMGDPVKVSYSVWSPKRLQVWIHRDGAEELEKQDRILWDKLRLYEVKIEANQASGMFTVNTEFDIGVGGKPYYKSLGLRTGYASKADKLTNLKKAYKGYLSFNVPGSPNWDAIFYNSVRPKTFLSAQESKELFKSSDFRFSDTKLLSVEMDFSSVRDYLLKQYDNDKTEKITKDLETKKNKKINALKDKLSKNDSSASFESQLDDLFDENNINQNKDIEQKIENVKYEYEEKKSNRLSKLKNKVDFISDKISKDSDKVRIAMADKKAWIIANGVKESLGTFTDKETGLMWQDDEDAKTLELNWNSAMSYCENLELGGYDDWRLPYSEKLERLYSKKSKLKNVAFDYYWSSSVFSDSSGAWLVGFDSGYTGSFTLSGKIYVRCVRGRQ